MFSFSVISDDFKSTAAQATKWSDLVQIVRLFRGQCCPCTIWALFRTQDHLDPRPPRHFETLPFRRFSSHGFNSESFRNIHPIETGFHSEWLRYNPKGPRGPILPKGAEGALRYPWAPWGSLGSPWAHPKGSAPYRSDGKASREFGGGAALPERGYWVGGMRVSVFGFCTEKASRRSLLGG